MAKMLMLMFFLVLLHRAVAQEVTPDQLSLLMSKLDLMENKDQQHEAEKQKLHEDIQLLNSNIEKVTSDNEHLQAMNQKMSTEINQLKSHVEHLETMNQKILADVDELQSNDQQLKSILHEQKQAVQILSENLRNVATAVQAGRPDDITDTVAFSVYHTLGNVVYGSGERILFDGVIYNSGNFSLENSSFTCPTTGLYYFNINICLYMDGTAGYDGGADLLMDGSSIFRVYSGGNDYHTDTVSGSVITMCSAGQVAYVQAYYTSEIYSTEGNRRTTFNGLLLAK